MDIPHLEVKATLFGGRRSLQILTTLNRWLPNASHLLSPSISNATVNIEIIVMYVMGMVLITLPI